MKQLHQACIVRDSQKCEQSVQFKIRFQLNLASVFKLLGNIEALEVIHDNLIINLNLSKRLWENWSIFFSQISKGRSDHLLVDVVDPHGSSLGDECWKTLSVGPPYTTVCSVFSTIQGKTMATPFQALLLRGYTTAIITAHAPGPYNVRSHVRCTCGRVLAPCPTPSAPKQWKSDVLIKVKHCQREMEFEKEKL